MAPSAAYDVHDQNSMDARHVPLDAYAAYSLVTPWFLPLLWSPFIFTMPHSVPPHFIDLLYDMHGFDVVIWDGNPSNMNNMNLLTLS